MCINPIKILNPKTKDGFIEVPCGKCILCRRKKCRQWAIKLYHESQYYNKMCMITLTFRPKFLLRPKIKKITKYYRRRKIDGTIETNKKEYETMISPEYITDVKKTGWLLTLFIKKLRKLLSKKDRFISYFAVGEHGTQNTHRAHWHIIFFGIDKNDLNSVNIGKSKKNKEIYFSPIIDNLWSYEKLKIGQHTVSDVTSKTIKYVANYTMKKMYNNGTQYPVTMRCSSHNKIGKKWARRYHKELRKGYLKDEDGLKYNIPESYYKEMIRYEGQESNRNYELTANYIEDKKFEMIEKLKKLGLLNKDELKKKARKLEIRYKKEDRDTF